MPEPERGGEGHVYGLLRVSESLVAEPGLGSTAHVPLLERWEEHERGTDRVSAGRIANARRNGYVENEHPRARCPPRLPFPRRRTDMVLDEPTQRG